MSLLVLPSAIPCLKAQMAGQVLVFPLLVAGGGWEAEFTILARGEDRSSGVFRFMNQQGRARSLTVASGNVTEVGVSSVFYNIPALGSRTYRITSGQVALGYIETFSNPSDHDIRGMVDGVPTFRLRHNNQVVRFQGI